MKKIKDFAYASAMLLAGTMAFTACSSSDDVADDATVNPTYNGESVKTQFVINIPRAASTRMTAATAQVPTGEQTTSDVFRGMDNIYLIPVTTSGVSSTNTETDDPIDGKDTYSRIISLPEIAKGGWSTSTDGIDTEVGNTKVYKDIDIDVNTNHFLFYAHAKDDASNTDSKYNGVLQTNLTNTAATADVTFNLKQICKSSEDLSSEKTKYAAYLNAVATSFALIRSSLVDTLKMLTCGSSNAILETMQRFYDANKGAEAVATAIEQESNNDLTYKISISKDGDLSWSGPTSVFPGEFNLPDGAVPLTYSNNKFSYADNFGLGDNNIAVSSICYPSSLNYFVSTALKANDNETVNFPKSDDWENSEYVWSGWDGYVKEKTRTIALQKPINYGVALLNTTVKCEDDKKVLADNGADSRFSTYSGVTQYVKIPEEGFKVTGILVGGQPVKLGWDMKPASSTTYDETVYDSECTDIYAKAGTYSDPIYTILLDNYNSVSTASKDVNVALELENNSESEFFGHDGLIQKKQKFYLIGKLTFDSNTSTTYPSVFMQDYTTKATFTIESLKNAYSCIPDLRASALRLGLHVDLTWQTGLTYDITIE